MKVREIDMTWAQVYACAEANTVIFNAFSVEKRKTKEARDLWMYAYDKELKRLGPDFIGDEADLEMAA